MVGLPDYAVVVAVWPWPDGGWMAGAALLDRDGASGQGLASGLLALPEESNPPFNIYDGFPNGINRHAPTAGEAIQSLWTAVHHGR